MILAKPITYGTHPTLGERFYLAVWVTTAAGDALVCRQAAPDAACLGGRRWALDASEKIHQLRQLVPAHVPQWIESQGLSVRLEPEIRLPVTTVEAAVTYLEEHVLPPKLREREHPDPVERCMDRRGAASRFLDTRKWGKVVKWRLDSRTLVTKDPWFGEHTLPIVQQYVEGRGLLLLEPVYMDARDPAHDAEASAGVIARLSIATREAWHRRYPLTIAAYILGEGEAGRLDAAKALRAAGAVVWDMGRSVDEGAMRLAVLGAHGPDLVN